LDSPTLSTSSPEIVKKVTVVPVGRQEILKFPLNALEGLKGSGQAKIGQVGIETGVA
jgi:hypothetical protein